MTKNEKVHAIIHSASVAAAGVGGGLAQIPCSDALVLAPLQTAMITAIAKVHGHSLSEAAAEKLLATFLASTIGRAISQALVGWIPGIGNAINAATAAALTEAVGWSADAYFAS
jgi:uncharacterized protein (DUF697 family)